MSVAKMFTFGSRPLGEIDDGVLNDDLADESSMKNGAPFNGQIDGLGGKERNGYLTPRFV